MLVRLWSLKPVRSLTVQLGAAIADELLRTGPPAIEGRTRLPVRGLRNSPVRAQAIEAALGTLEGVDTVRASAITGNVLVHFDPRRVDQADIRHIIEHEGLGLLPLHSNHPQGHGVRVNWPQSGNDSGSIQLAPQPRR